MTIFTVCIGSTYLGNRNFFRNKLENFNVNKNLEKPGFLFAHDLAANGGALTEQLNLKAQKPGF